MKPISDEDDEDDESSSPACVSLQLCGQQEGSRTPGSEPTVRDAREFSSGFHGGGGKHGQFHDSGEELGSVSLSLLDSKTGAGDEASVLDQLICHL